MDILAGKKIAILVANGFEETHMTDSQKALLAAGAQVKLISSELNLVNGWHETAWGHFFPVDGGLADTLAADYDAVLVPGGFRSIERLAKNAHSLRILKGFIDGGKAVVAVGHAQLLIVDADRHQGRTLAGGDQIADKLSGATISEDESVIDLNLLTVKDGVAPDVLKEAVLEHFTGILSASFATAA